MRAVTTLLLVGPLLAMRSPGRVIVIDMVRDEHGQTYFMPNDVEAQRGDTLRFVEHAGTHNVYFLPDSNPGAVHLPPRSPLVETPGAALDIVVTFGPGRYYFQCDPHVSRGMIGHLRVVAPSTRAPIVLLVRHANKAVAATLDPPLSRAGHARAVALAEALRDAGVTQIMVDQSQRTRETAQPLGQRHGLRPEVIPIDWNDPTSQIRAIADSVRRPGAVTLVIGHRNTVPAIIRALGGPEIPEMADADYDDLYVMILDSGSAAPVVIHSSYGVVSSPGP